MNKKCFKCQKTKPIIEFYKKYTQDGTTQYHSYCKMCHIKSKRENRKTPSKYLDNIEMVRGILKENDIANFRDKTTYNLIRLQNAKTVICKFANIKMGSFTWDLSYYTRKNFIPSDYVILGAFFLDHEKYFVFPSNHFLFYKTNGMIKKTLRYIVNALYNKETGFVEKLANYHENNFALLLE